MVPAEDVICEHYYFKSSAAILARAFCNSDKETIPDIEKTFDIELKKLRAYEKSVSEYTEEEFKQHHIIFCEKINKIVDEIKKV